jgi:hypothetical protein
MKNVRTIGLVVLSVAVMASAAVAGPLDPAVQAKVDAQVKAIQAWAADPAVVAAVKAQNASPAADVAAMTQDKWTGLSVLDPFVRALTKNAAATFLKGKKTDAVNEAFVSSADGAKVAFLSKTTNWSHKGKPKHDLPMSGKTWQGAVEVDESTGVQQVQVSVPVMDGGKAIGSLVVGVSPSKL